MKFKEMVESLGLNESVQPKSSKELLEIVKKTIKEKGNKCDLNFIDTSKITDMADLFSWPETKNFNGDISKWNTSNVTDMSNMFETSKFNGDISKWNTSKVTNMAGMFCESDFNQNINNWNVSNVKYFEGTFDGAKFNKPLDKWEPKKVTTMEMMFEDADFNSPIFDIFDYMPPNGICSNFIHMFNGSKMNNSKFIAQVESFIKDRDSGGASEEINADIEGIFDGCPLRRHFYDYDDIKEISIK